MCNYRVVAYSLTETTIDYYTDRYSDATRHYHDYAENFDYQYVILEALDHTQGVWRIQRSNGDPDFYYRSTSYADDYFYGGPNA